MDTAKSNDRKLNGFIPYRGQIPRLHPLVFVAERVKIIGDVEIEEKSCIWFNTVVRGDVNYICIGACTNVQDNSVLYGQRRLHRFISARV
jgi:carbonic anhydrase/acetyltransferase-like protein (isoleucine patch superfamily)